MRRKISFPFRSQLFIVNSLIIAILLINISYFSYKKTEPYIRETSSAAYGEVLKQANVTLSYKMKNYERVINTFYINEKFQQILTASYATKYEEYEANRQLNDFIESILNTYEYVPQIRIYNFNSGYSYFGIVYDESHIRDKQWEKIVRENTQSGVYWSAGYAEDNPQALKIRAAKALRNQADNRVYGILALEINADYLFNQFASIDLFKDGNVYVIDQSGNVLFSQDEQPFNLDMREADTPDVYIEQVGRMDHLVVRSRVPGAPWMLVGTIPLKNALLLLSNMRDYIIVQAVVLLFFGFAVMYGLSWFFSKRLSRLKNEMIKVSQGELEIVADTADKDEIGDINRVFQVMVKRLRKYTEEIGEMQRREFELRMQALQAEINPHFLYNTLSAINWMAIDAKAGQISQTVNALAKYYRIALSKGDDIITIRSELDQVKAYIFIQQIRIRDHIRFEFAVDEALLDHLMPKMVLQPIVENAIYHGIESKRKTGTIRIGIQRHGERIRIEVADDGVGIGKQKIAELLMAKRASGSYGLFNIASKIKLYYGADFGLDILSEPDKGTCVMIHIPYRPQHEPEEEAAWSDS